MSKKHDESLELRLQDLPLADFVRALIGVARLPHDPNVIDKPLRSGPLEKRDFGVIAKSPTKPGSR